MDNNKIRKMLKQHRLWLNCNGGERINLHRVELRNADLHEANLRGANLRNDDLSNVNLCGADLREADLHGADLSGADLGWANLCNTDLSYANLYGANLLGANLNCAGLHGAILDNVKYNCETNFFALQCPEEGSFIGYKKARGYIVKLEILSNAKRSSATTRKCRCSAARVLSITTLDGKDDGTQFISSGRDSDFIYQVGEIVRVDDFDENRWNECSTGIHFFITRSEAVKYDSR